jgi:ATP-dependent Clp protease, protease subunit
VIEEDRDDSTTSIEEQSASDKRAFDIYSRLLRDRIIFLESQIDRDVANLIVAQLLFLEAEDREKDIYIYINSPGGSVSAGMGIFDTMSQIHPNVCTVCMGFAGGMASFLLGAGTKGKRMSLPSSRIMLCQPVGSPQGQAVDIAIQTKEILYIKGKLNDLLAKHTGQLLEKIETDTALDFYMSAEEAKEYGLIDLVVDRHVSAINPL